MTQSLSCRVSSRISALRNRPSLMLSIDASTLLDLVAEQLERAPVHERGAAVQVQAGVRMRHGEHGFLNRDIRRLTIRQDVPRNERAVVLLGRRLGPACPQQRLVRERSLEADAVQRLFRPLEVGRFEQDGAQHQVGLVADRESRRDHRPPAARPCPVARWLPAAGRPATARCRGCRRQTRSGSRRCAAARAP